MASVIILNVLSPSKLAAELELFGHHVWEALDVSEVLFLCEQHSIDAVLIAAEVEHGELIEKQLRAITHVSQLQAESQTVFERQVTENAGS